MKCPVCKEEVNELEESCPHCQINFSDFLREINNRDEKERTNKENNNNKTIWIIGAIILIIIILIFVPDLIESKKSLDTAKKEYNLIQEGKTKSSDEIMNEIIEILKNKDKDKIKQYISSEFVYYDNDNAEHKYISSFFEDLRIYTTSCETEKRGNSIKDAETYRIYWNVVEENKNNGIKRQERGYCLQTLTIMLKRIVKQDTITYEIERIILKDA